MGKQLRKSEKLDLILSELANLRSEVKKLVRGRAVVADQGMKAKPKSAAGRSKKPPKPTGAGKKPDRDVAPSKPGLVQAPQVPNRLTDLHLMFFSRLRPKRMPAVQHRLSHRENRDDAVHADQALGRPDYP